MVVRRWLIGGAAAALALGYAVATRAPGAPRPAGVALAGAERIAPYEPRFARARPVVAVIAENLGTEVSDYLVPYGVLAESGAAEVVAVATEPGPIRLMPALRVDPQETIASFDARFPEGADYVVVPAVHRQDDPALLGWVAAQAGKGASVVGVCDGAWVVAGVGLLRGRRATGHWYSFEALERRYPETRWTRDSRYVVDGPIVTTTGVTASIPVSLALVEAIAGGERAEAVARDLGATDWSAAHRSDDFRLGARAVATAAGNLLAFWSHEEVGIPIDPGVDEVALALVADAYSRTYRSQALAVSTADGRVRSRHGLSLIPDRVGGAPGAMLPPLGARGAVPALDGALTGIAERYGPASAAFVALQIEYPLDPNREGDRQ